MRSSFRTPRTTGLELAQATRAAEVVGGSLVLLGVRRVRDRDGHPADRIDRGLDELCRRRSPCMAPCDELGEDRDRDLLLCRRAEIEAGGAADMRERLLVHPSLA